MIDFHNKNLDEHELFSDFSKACRGLRSSAGDPLLIDMAIESFPLELRGPALLHAHWLAANFNSKKLMAYTNDHGIHQKYPELQQSVEIANIILRNMFQNPSRAHPEFVEILQNTIQRLGVEFAIDIIDQAFTDNEKVAERLELVNSIIPVEMFRSLEVGNHIACRLAVCCEGDELKDQNKQVLRILDIVRDCSIDDIGSINILLAEDVPARTEKIFPQLQASYLPALRKGLSYEMQSILPTALRIMPKALLGEVLSFDDTAFKRLVRGQFLDAYLGSGWMEPIGSLDRRYKELEFSEIVRAFNSRLLSDESIRYKIGHHPSMRDGNFEGLEILYLLPELEKSNIHLSIETAETSFAELVDFIRPYEHLKDLYGAGLSVIRYTFERKAEKLYDEVYQDTDIKLKLKSPDSVSSEYKLGQIAVMLMCELNTRDSGASDVKQQKLAPIHHMIRRKPRRDSDWMLSDALMTYARSIPEDEVLQAVGKRKNYLTIMVNEGVLGKEHYGVLPLKDRATAFIEELGV